MQSGQWSPVQHLRCQMGLLHHMKSQVLQQGKAHPLLAGTPAYRLHALCSLLTVRQAERLARTLQPHHLQVSQAL